MYTVYAASSLMPKRINFAACVKLSKRMCQKAMANFLLLIRSFCRQAEELDQQYGK